MAEIITVPLEDAKKLLIALLKDVEESDLLKYTTVWTKEPGSNRMFKGVNIEIRKGSSLGKSKRDNVYMDGGGDE